MIRGRRTTALACRKPDGGIYRYREPLDSLLVRSKVVRAPFIRGVFVLWESLSYGMRMLMRSADVQLAGEQDEAQPAIGKGGSAAIMFISLAFALVGFIGGPYAATGLLRSSISSSLWL